jgi:hypothetical protein
MVSRHNILSLLLIFVVCLMSTIAISNDKPVSNQITDVSWPNCKSQRFTNYGSGIVGVTGGLDFHKNPCLNDETTWFSNYSLYLNTGYPGPNYRPDLQKQPLNCNHSNIACRAYNYGYNSALYALNYANSLNVHSNRWWVDVESDNSWTKSAIVNQSSILGTVDAIDQKVPFASVGIYSYPSQWQAITAGWRIDLPTWVATGSYSQSIASNACTTRSFTGGKVWLSQYTRRLDQNLQCNDGYRSSFIY